ncbi:MAG TPA: hypothetical protein VL294_12645 [Pseudolysinimonas sp.]|nr:hypothetical protein [Pseudolysinimonas sp.]
MKTETRKATLDVQIGEILGRVRRRLDEVMTDLRCELLPLDAFVTLDQIEEDLQIVRGLAYEMHPDVLEIHEGLAFILDLRDL